MKIYIAENAGYCFGVKRAANIAEEAIKEANGIDIYSLGRLVHNPQVVDKLQKKGLKLLMK